MPVFSFQRSGVGMPVFSFQRSGVGMPVFSFQRAGVGMPVLTLCVRLLTYQPGNFNIVDT